MNFTPAQLEAIREPGNTLVMAGAGTGKTRTLVKRCVDRLLDASAPVGLDEILVVTFTEAAAAEVRQRIRTALEEELERQPDNIRLPGQLAALDTAHICTLHSFCLQLIRQHFHELDIDPQPAVLAEEQSTLLAGDVLDDLLRHHYESDSPDSGAVQTLIQDHADGWDDRVKELIGQIHVFTQTRPDPEGWLQSQLESLSQPEPAVWREGWVEGFQQWKATWLPVLELQSAENPVAQTCADALRAVPSGETSASVTSMASLASILRTVLDADAQPWPKGKKTRLRKPLEPFFQEAAFLESLAPEDGGTDPMAEDWNWILPATATLLRLAREFNGRFAAAKRERGAVDFHDLEQFALRLLWDAGRRTPTDLARHWQARLKLVFVDEYQDINEAQDTILTALGREGAAGNRFLVGDVKQSIYRFRQAAPHIFQNYAAEWAADPGRGLSVWLSDNFRSREGVLRFINAFFATVMRQDFGGVAYDAKAQLQFGDPEGRAILGAASDTAPRVEVHLHLTDPAEGGAGEEEDSESGLDELSTSETEARFVAARLLELKHSRHPVWDTGLKAMRDADWNDMVVLLRAPRAKVEAYAKEFARQGVPLHAKRTGFFDSVEVLDLLHLLTLLDNPLQDIPTVAVLRSPLAGLSLEELAALRPAAPRDASFWTALRRWHQSAGPGRAGEGEADVRLFEKVSAFLARYDRWRSSARHMPLAHRIEMVLRDTCYMDWLLTQSRGEQRQANVSQLLTLAREFDELHAQGLHRFLRLIEAQQKAALDREPAPIDTENAVRLMSIHQSKGLEFPVVVLPDLGKRFNLSAPRGGLILDETFGLCLSVKPPGSGRRYPSLPLWLARNRQRLDALGEELRLLYVALTRARDTLILTGSCSESLLRETWPGLDGLTPPPHQLSRARCYLDWLGPWLAHQTGPATWADQPEGTTPLWNWKLHRAAWSSGPRTPEVLTTPTPGPNTGSPSPPLESIRERLSWSYPHNRAVHIAAKSSVTALKHALMEELDEEALPAVRRRFHADHPGTRPAGRLGAAQIGIAHHKFLQWVDLTRTGAVSELQAEARRLVNAGLLAADEQDALDWTNLERFWNSEPGQSFRNRAERVRREMPFTLRLTGRDLERMDMPLVASVPLDDFVIVQGVVDLALVLDEELWILDFKTDHVTASELDARIREHTPQLQLYALALERIHGKPVTRRWLHFIAMNHTHEVAASSKA